MTVIFSAANFITETGDRGGFYPGERERAGRRPLCSGVQRFQAGNPGAMPLSPDCCGKLLSGIMTGWDHDEIADGTDLA